MARTLLKAWALPFPVEGPTKRRGTAPVVDKSEARGPRGSRYGLPFTPRETLRILALDRQRLNAVFREI